MGLSFSSIEDNSTPGSTDSASLNFTLLGSFQDFCRINYIMFVEGEKKPSPAFDHSLPSSELLQKMVKMQILSMYLFMIKFFAILLVDLKQTCVIDF